MTATLDAVLLSWPFAPCLACSLLIMGVVYVRGARRMRWSGRTSAARTAAFLGGLAVLYLALASPIETFSSLLLQVHMVQHLLLMTAAPALLWLGEPLLPMLRGLPRWFRRDWVAPFMQYAPLQRLFAWLTHPMRGLLILTVATWVWHVPALYDLALQSAGWHYLQHAAFLLAGLLFWYPVIRPYPSRPGWSLWLLPPVLILADVSNTVLAALLTFSDRVLYTHYTQTPRLGGISALDDQVAAGVIMWVPGSLAFLLPLFVIALQLLGRPTLGAGIKSVHVRPLTPGPSPPRGEGRRIGRISLPVIPTAVQTSGAASAHHDIWRFLKWRHARLVMQLPLIVVAGLIIIDGLRGPQIAGMNLAGVVPWIHWRWLLIVGLLTLGNVFCMACPFTAPRTLARRLLPGRLQWPRCLRNKWPALGLLVLFFWAYEAFALWDSPWWTAWIALGYFTAAFIMDGLFRGAAFCKHLCPVGQFNFVQSLVSPLHVEVRSREVCSNCHTKECLPACDMGLSLPGKTSNMDCTFCLDCVRACPHDNIVVKARPVGTGDRGVIRFDVAVLIIVLVFAAFTNAAGMVAPVLEWQDALALHFGLGSTFWTVALGSVIGLMVGPFVLIAGAAILSRLWSGSQSSVMAFIARFARSLVPLGAAMWLAHYSYHFLTSWDGVIPVVQRIVLELGIPALGTPDWALSCCEPVGDWLPCLQIFILDCGLLLSLYGAYRIAEGEPQSLRAFMPWGALMLLLFCAGIWIILQPMQMRGAL